MLVPATIKLGLTVNVWPAIVTSAVEVPVGNATFEPPM